MQRGSLATTEATVAALLELFPSFSPLRLIRQWGGIVDIRPDTSPIIGMTPVENLYVSCAWGTGGYKAIPAGGDTLAHTIVHDKPHPLVEEFSLARFARGALVDEGGGSWRRALTGARHAWAPEPDSEKNIMMQIECPSCGRRDETEFSYGGEAHLARPALEVSDEWWAEYLFFRNNVKGVHAERWRHTRGCGQWFNAVRNTATHQFLTVYRATEPRPATAPEPQAGIAAGTGAASPVPPSPSESAEATSVATGTR